MAAMRKTVLSLCWGFLAAQNVGIGISQPTARLHIRSATFSATDYALRIDRSNGNVVLSVQSDGNVGIGTLSPAQRVEVVGNVYLAGDFRPGDNPGLPGQVLYSRGTGQLPVWDYLPMRLEYVDAWGPGYTNDLQGWTGAGITNCGGQWMLGGYGECGVGCVLSKTYTGLPPHHEVMVEVYYWAIDSWDQFVGAGLDHVRLELDGTVVARGTPIQMGISSYMGYPILTDLSFCGHNAWIDHGPIRIAGRISHTANTLQVRIVSGVTQPAWDESIGVTAVRVWLR